MYGFPERVFSSKLPIMNFMFIILSISKCFPKRKLLVHYDIRYLASNSKHVAVHMRCFCECSSDSLNYLRKGRCFIDCVGVGIQTWFIQIKNIYLKQYNFVQQLIKLDNN